MNKLSIGKITNFLYAHRKVISVIEIVYFAALIAYDIVFFNRDTKTTIITYILSIVICTLVWFGVRFVLWILTKNSSCPEEIFTVFSLIAMLLFVLSSVTLGIEYIANYFIVGAFVGPVAFLSVVYAQKFQKRYYKK